MERRMSDTNSEPQVDLQDPLPESSWFWRRVFVYTVTAAILWMLWGAIERLSAVAMVKPEQGVPALLTLCQWLLAQTILMATYYMVAPSAEQVVKMFKVATLLRGGVQVAGRQRIAADGSTDTAKTVGKPPAPPVPGDTDTEEPQPPWEVKDQ